MRICHIVEATAGGSARIVSQLIRGSLAEGHDVSLIYSPQRADQSFLSALDAMPSLRRIALPMERGISLDDISKTARLFRLLRHHGPFDILHGHASKAGALSRITGLLMPGAVKVYTPHGFFALTPGASPVYSWMEWALSWITDSIITVSHREMRLACEKMHIASDKLKVILNGIELDYTADRAAARQRMGYDDSDYVVGFVGRLVEIKNPRRLIDSFALLARQNPAMRLAIVGQGPLKENMLQWLSDSGLSDKARFIDHPDARDIMAGFDCLLCTSNVESFGLVIVEALNAGIPVVTTPVGISDMAIIDGVTGYIGQFTAESLASGAQKLAALSIEDRRHMSAACKIKARQFDITTMIENTHNLYHDLLQRRRHKNAV